MLNFLDNSGYLSIDYVVDSKESGQSSLPTTGEKEINSTTQTDNKRGREGERVRTKNIDIFNRKQKTGHRKGY